MVLSEPLGPVFVAGPMMVCRQRFRFVEKGKTLNFTHKSVATNRENRFHLSVFAIPNRTARNPGQPESGGQHSVVLFGHHLT